MEHHILVTYNIPDIVLSALHVLSNLTFTAILSGRSYFLHIIDEEERKLSLKNSILIGFSFKNNYAAEINSNIEATRKLKMAWPDFTDEHGESV